MSKLSLNDLLERVRTQRAGALRSDELAELMATIEIVLRGMIVDPLGLPFRAIGTVEAKNTVESLAIHASKGGLPAANDHRAVLLDVIAHRDHLASQVTELQEAMVDEAKPLVEERDVLPG